MQVISHQVSFRPPPLLAVRAPVPLASSSPPSLPCQGAREDASLCALLLRLLPARDAASQWYTTRDVARVFGLQPRAVMKHCRDLFPDKKGGHYRLDRAEAERVVKRICQAGKKVPSRESVLARVRSVETGGAS